MPQTYLIYGDDDYRVAQKTREIIESVLPENDRLMGLESIDGAVDRVEDACSAMKRCFEALQMVGFFSDRKVTWLRNVSFLTDNNVGRSETVKNMLNDLAGLLKGGLPEGQAFVVTSPKVDKRGRFFKTFKEAGEMFEFAALDEKKDAQNTAEILRDALADAGIGMNRTVGTAFLEKVGANTRDIINEVGKLALYLGDRKEAGLEDIEAITSPSRKAISWDLADAFGRRDLKKAIQVTRQLLFQKENEIGLIMGLHGRVKDLMIYRQALDEGWLNKGGKWSKLPSEAENAFESMERDPRQTHPYRAKLLAQQASMFTMKELRKCQESVMDTHHKMVSSQTSKQVVLELLLIKLLS